MVVYFSGTGNSRYIAEYLADALHDETFDVGVCTRGETVSTLASEKPWIFVAPVYVSAPAKAMLDFVKNTTFSGEKRAWFLADGAGEKSAASAYAERLCRRKGFSYMGTASLAMPQNYLLYFRMKTEDEIDAMLTRARTRLRGFAAAVRDGLPFEGKTASAAEYLMTEAVRVLYYRFFMSAKPFHATDACVGCGKCASVCPYANIRIAENRPAWGKNCTHCMGCINACPTRAIEYGNRTAGKPRYTCAVYEKDGAEV